MKNKKSQNGRSMVEMLGVLAIIGVLSVGAIWGYNFALKKYKVNKTVEAFMIIVAELEIQLTEAGYDYKNIGIYSTSQARNEYFKYDENSIAARILKNVGETPYPIQLYAPGNNMLTMTVPNIIGSKTRDGVSDVCRILTKVNWQAISPRSFMTRTLAHCAMNDFLINFYVW